MFHLILLASTLALTNGCGNSLVGSGTFTSPNYPSPYTDNAYCSWTLTADAGKFICIDFDDFSTEPHYLCNLDYLLISDPEGGVFGRYCGTTTPGFIVTQKSVVTVLFESDSSLAYGGFSARFTSCEEHATHPPTIPPPPGCGGTFTGASGTFTSPGYPNSYAANSYCTYTIEAGDGPILISINDMDIEAHSTCAYDFLEHRGTRACGTRPTTFLESDGTATLRFVSDSSSSGQGFSATWERLDCDHYGGQCTAEGSCDGTVMSAACPDGGVCCIARGDCGKIPLHPNTWIINGDDSSEHAWPWQASLQTPSGFHFCGATLIANQWLVTAAHCIDGSSPASVKVILGEHHMEQPGMESTHAIAEIIPHENYNSGAGAFPNDIALLRLDEPVIFSNHIQPACLANPGDEFSDNNNCWITGWGNTENGTPDILQELNIDVLEQAQCETMWSGIINPGHVCLGDGTSGACNGDSGGPLVCQIATQSGNYWKLAGATSWGRSGCQTEGYPSVYSRISYFRDWIDLKMAAFK